jgi:hypothetical protein
VTMEITDIKGYIIEQTNKAVEGWLEENPPDKLAAETRKILDRDSREVLRKLMGFDKRYSGWQVDHCNGRGGASPIGERLKELRADVLEEWITTVEFPPLTEKMKKSMIETYTSVYLNQFNARIKDTALRAANDAADTVLAELDALPQLASEQALRILLQGNK